MTQFWRELLSSNSGIRVQIHTHPDKAFHSATDDAWPIIGTAGFLSLVVPRFALGPIGFREAYLAELCADGAWQRVPVTQRLEVV